MENEAPAEQDCSAFAAVKSITFIRHSRNDDVIPFADSEELIANSGLPETALASVIH